MYIPEINAVADQAEVVAFMKQFSFATIITSKNNFPTATHLPFVVTVKEDQIILTSHFAKANAHWQDIENNKVLVIFNEPHAYISTKNYDTELNVPTWNYISIHAYGQGKLITETQEVMEILDRSIENYEFEYKQRWSNFPDDYKLKMSKGIMAFEIRITDLQAKKKLSQNRTETEQKNIIGTLSTSTNTNEKLIAEYMKNNLKSI
ncbi:MAG: FMN-binding negative transcriptional regulator [Sediminibacterium sp.]|nr:FMN-binding negative transcriptional regulator [Sediminibacterium sp.]